MILKIRTTLLLFVIFINYSYSQVEVSLKEIGIFAQKLYEVSGILIDLNKDIWVHNDSGHKPEIYKIDENCNIIRTVSISNAKNIDWEDITSDRKGKVFIGDFGNNLNTRETQKIYIIPDPVFFISNEIVAKTIEFMYPDQDSFPPEPKDMNYDMESFVYFKDSLYLFTKNQTQPFDGYTRMYTLPAKEGRHVAKYKGRYYCGAGPKELYWITSADISPDGKSLVLLSSMGIWRFTDFVGDNFFGGKVTVFVLNDITQKEGIAYINNNDLYVVDERFVLMGVPRGGKLYKVHLPD